MKEINLKEDIWNLIKKPTDYTQYNFILKCDDSIDISIWDNIYSVLLEENILEYIKHITEKETT